MNILDPIFYRTLFYDFRPVISPGPVSTSPYIVFKFVGVSLPSTHVCSFFLSSFRRLYLGLLKLVPFFFSSQRASIHMGNHRHPVKVGNWIPLLKRVGLGDPSGRLLSWLMSPWTKISVQLVMISVFHLMNLQTLSVPILASDDMFFNIITADTVLKRKDGDKFWRAQRRRQCLCSSFWSVA
jgi:hypothetical protein